MAEEQKIGLHVEAASIRTSYVNAFQTRYAEGEVFLTCGVSHVEPSQNEAEAGALIVEMQERIAMTPQSAHRLAATLIRTLQEYEGRFGPIMPAPSADGEKKNG